MPNNKNSKENGDLIPSKRQEPVLGKHKKTCKDSELSWDWNTKPIQRGYETIAWFLYDTKELCSKRVSYLVNLYDFLGLIT